MHLHFLFLSPMRGRELREAMQSAVVRFIAEATCGRRKGTLTVVEIQAVPSFRTLLCKQMELSQINGELHVVLLPWMQVFLSQKKCCVCTALDLGPLMREQKPEQIIRSSFFSNPRRYRKFMENILLVPDVLSHLKYMNITKTAYFTCYIRSFSVQKEPL